MWNRLTLQYAETSAANVSLLGKFHQYKMDPDHSIMAHINRLRMMADELKSNDVLTVMVKIIQTVKFARTPCIASKFSRVQNREREYTRVGWNKSLTDSDSLYKNLAYLYWSANEQLALQRLSRRLLQICESV
jgi:hypothetical protein